MRARTVIKVEPAPKVNLVASGQVKISGPGPHALSVELTRAVEGEPVVVECSTSPLPSGGEFDVQLSFATPTVDVGQNTTQVQFTLLAAGSAVAVTCRGQSSNGGTQYLNATSAGSSVEVAVDTPVAVLQPSTLDIIGAKGQAANVRLLLSDPPLLADVVFNCTLEAVGGGAVALPFARVEPTSVVFPRGSDGRALQRDLTLYSVDTGLQQLVCRVPASNPSEYRGQEAAASVFVLLLRVYTINWDEVPLVASAEVSAVSTQLGNCLCDLTASQCDANCCCDPDCSVLEKDAFALCAPETPTELFKERCASWATLRSTPMVYAYPVFCVVTDNNPSLGLVFQSPSLVTDPLLFPAAAARSGQHYTYGVAQAGAGAASASRYQVRTPVLSVSRNVAFLLGQLGFPARAADGSCVDLSPGLYLAARDRYDYGFSSTPATHATSAYSASFSRAAESGASAAAFSCLRALGSDLAGVAEELLAAAEVLAAGHSLGAPHFGDGDSDSD